jgi:hypothetical protein
VTPAMGIPPFGTLQRALRRVTNRLINEVDAPTFIPPDWSRIEWAVARSVSAIQGISGLLANRLRWREPRDFLEFLAEQREHTVAFRDCARTALARIDAAARAAGVPVVALKGAATFGMKLHGRGERPMADLDLLIEPSGMEAMQTVMTSCGYVHSHTTRRHVAFKPAADRPTIGFGEHGDNPVRVDLHTRITEHLPVSEVDATPTIMPAILVPGINGYASRVSLFRHLLLHAAGNMRGRTFRAIQAFDAAALAGVLETADWAELLDDARFATWWLYPPLAVTAHVRPGCIPASVMECAARACPRWLRRRMRHGDMFEVSLSNLRIAALAGIEWSRTPAEALRLLRRRLIPNPQELTELREGMGGMPKLLELPWYQLSHPQRILRWVLGRAPRVQTMISVQAALHSMR